MHLTGIEPARASMSDGLDDRLPTCADPDATIATPSTLGPPGVILRVRPSASKYPRLRATISPIWPLLTIHPSWNVTSVVAPRATRGTERRPPPAASPPSRAIERPSACRRVMPASVFVVRLMTPPPSSPGRARPDPRGSASDAPAQHGPAQARPPRHQEPGHGAGDQHLRDVDEHVEPAHRQLAADPAGGEADEDAGDAEDP